MTSVIIAFPRIEDAKNIKNLLVRNGIPVAGTCTTGARALNLADSLNGGIIICGYKMADMMYAQLYDDLPAGFEMLLAASRQVLGAGMQKQGLICLPLPLKAHDLLSTVHMMIQAKEAKRRKQKAAKRERNPEELRLIKEAKEVLMDRNHMSEEEAHRYIQKCSMDSGTNMAETAQMVLAMLK